MIPESNQSPTHNNKPKPEISTPATITKHNNTRTNTLPNRVNIMNEKEFHQYHKKPIPTIKKILKIAPHLFYTSTCADACQPPYNTHQQSYTLLPKIANRPNQNFYHNPLPENNPIAAIQEPPKPPKRMQKLQDYPITTITNTKQSKRKDKFDTIKLFTSYKCT
jgi:hypothetical protein